MRLSKCVKYFDSKCVKIDAICANILTLEINASRSQLTVTALGDTGSTRTLMDYDTWTRLVSRTKINCEYKLGPSSILVTLTGTPIDIKGTVNIHIQINLLTYLLLGMW